VAFTDMSGGKLDSAAVAIGHREDDVIVIDVARERRAPFNPDDVVREFATLVRRTSPTSLPRWPGR
jgi:hypothetical protein